MLRNILFLVVLTLFGCAHPIAENLRREADPYLTFAQLFESPDSYVGAKIILGGVIVKTTNYPDRAEIELVQKEINAFGNLMDNDTSKGRFIFINTGFVEPEIYAKGREITGFGKIAGSRMGKVDDREYRYPVIEVEALHLWEKRDPYPYRFNAPYWNSPYYYGYPGRRSPFYGYW